jgi:hypothetical protein
LPITHASAESTLKKVRHTQHRTRSRCLLQVHDDGHSHFHSKFIAVRGLVVGFLFPVFPSFPLLSFHLLISYSFTLRVPISYCHICNSCRIRLARSHRLLCRPCRHAEGVPPLPFASTHPSISLIQHSSTTALPQLPLCLLLHLIHQSILSLLQLPTNPALSEI